MYYIGSELVRPLWKSSSTIIRVLVYLLDATSCCGWQSCVLVIFQRCPLNFGQFMLLNLLLIAANLFCSNEEEKKRKKKPHRPPVPCVCFSTHFQIRPYLISTAGERERKKKASKRYLYCMINNPSTYGYLYIEQNDSVFFLRGFLFTLALPFEHLQINNTQRRFAVTQPRHSQKLDGRIYMF